MSVSGDAGRIVLHLDHAKFYWGEWKELIRSLHVISRS